MSVYVFQILLESKSTAESLDPANEIPNPEEPGCRTQDLQLLFISSVQSLES